VLPYLESTCVLGVELYYRLSAAGNFNLVLRAEPRHHCIVPQSVICIPSSCALLEAWRTFDRVGASAVDMLAMSHPSFIASLTHDMIATENSDHGP
jgi:hypothetical protein